jgi:hypothetical protein
MANETGNVVRSFQRRCESELTTDQLIFGKQDVGIRSLSSWMRCSYLEIDPEDSRLAQRDEDHLFQISCFAQTGTDGEGEFKVWSMHDDVRAAFHGITFELKDWADTESVLAQIRCGVVRGRIVSETNPELTHLACSFTGTIIFNP